MASRHKQLRLNSCFQSAPEMWLKLKGVIQPDCYPEQSNFSMDQKGYTPFPKGGIKIYGRKRVCFDKQHFNSPYAGMHERFLDELDRGNPVVVSLPVAGNYHGYLLYSTKGSKNYRLISKTSPFPAHPSVTIEDELEQYLQQHVVIDCLFMSRPKDRPQARDWR